MPKVKQALLSFSATGKIGGYRKVPTTRKVYTVDSFPTSVITTTINNVNFTLATEVFFMKFYLPFHLTVNKATLYITTANSPQKLRYGIYNEKATQLLGQGESAAAPSANGYHDIVFAQPLRLVPGAYYQAIMLEVNAGSVQALSPTQDSFNGYELNTGGLQPMFAGRQTLVNGGNFPATLDLFTSTRVSNAHVQARLH